MCGDASIQIEGAIRCVLNKVIELSIRLTICEVRAVSSIGKNRIKPRPGAEKEHFLSIREEHFSCDNVEDPSIRLSYIGKSYHEWEYFYQSQGRCTNECKQKKLWCMGFVNFVSNKLQKVPFSIDMYKWRTCCSVGCHNRRKEFHICKVPIGSVVVFLVKTTNKIDLNFQIDDLWLPVLWA